MEEKYGKLNENFREQIKYLILSKMNRNRIESSSQILEEYRKYYENLLKTRHSEIAEETQIQCKVEKEFHHITNRKRYKKERINEIILTNAIRRMKK